mmetsp:Transcript_25490/g.85302  ORF Transcript_25490/g.85302 Transcript_25490/m.85302 type:complete len:209 (-) Transcript_25490:462-1088(-)
MLRSVQAEAIDVREGDPMLEQIGEDLLEVAVLGVVIKHAFDKVTEDGGRGVARGVQHGVGPAAVEEGLRAKGWEEGRGKIQAGRPGLADTRLLPCPVGLVHRGRADLVVRRSDVARVDIAHVVDNYIHHHGDVALVSLGHEGPELGGRAEAGVDGRQVGGTVPVVAAAVHQHRRDPQGLHAQVLEVAQSVPNALNVAAVAPVGQTSPA